MRALKMKPEVGQVLSLQIEEQEEVPIRKWD